MDANEPDRALVTVREAARHHGIYPRQLWRSIRDGSLPAYQIGGWQRVRLADVDAWLETRRVPCSHASIQGGDGNERL
jgi:excisionase family DNA binding protein